MKVKMSEMDLMGNVVDGNIESLFALLSVEAAAELGSEMLTTRTKHKSMGMDHFSRGEEEANVSVPNERIFTFVRKYQSEECVLGGIEELTQLILKLSLRIGMGYCADHLTTIGGGEKEKASEKKELRKAADLADEVMAALAEILLGNGQKVNTGKSLRGERGESVRGSRHELTRVHELDQQLKQTRGDI